MKPRQEPEGDSVAMKDDHIFVFANHSASKIGAALSDAILRAPMRLTSEPVKGCIRLCVSMDVDMSGVHETVRSVARDVRVLEAPR